MNATEYMNEAVNYGGLIITRVEMIADLTRLAEASGHANPQALISRYMQGASR